MERDEQLRWERDNARWAAGAAALSAILLVAGGLFLVSRLQGDSGDDAIDQVLLVSHHKTDLIISAVLTALGTALLAAPLYYLFRATRFRREQLPRGIRYLLIIAPVAGAIASVIHQVQTAHVSDKIVAQLPLAVSVAEDRIKDEAGQGAFVAVGGVGTAAGLGIAFSFILLSLNGMRAGLLSRFMGIFGVIVGVLVVIPLQAGLPFPIVEVYWLGALAALFLGYWPGGRGPAWVTGTEEPWPTAQDRRDAAMGIEPGSRRGRGSAPETELDEELEPDEDDDVIEAPAHTGEPARPRPSAPQHPRSKKRKRKRRG